MFAERLPSLAVVTLLLLVAACSGGGSQSDESSGVDAPAGPITIDGTSSGDPAADGEGGSDSEMAERPDPNGETTEAEPESIEELEASWAAGRATVIESIRAGGYGVNDDDVLTGPGGFTVDLNQCPAGWINELGPSDPVALGYTSPRTGNLFAYGLIATGLEAYLGYVNAAGGVAGHQLDVLVRDDAYNTDLTVDLVDQLLEVERPFAVTTFGAPGTFAVREQLNQQCIPQPFVGSNHPAWGDPANYPWTTGMQLAYSTEALLWGEWIEQNMADELPVTVAALVIDSEFGDMYQDEFARWVADNPDVVSSFLPVRHEPRASTVVSQLSQLAEQSPDVFIAMTNGDACLATVLAADQVGLRGSETMRFTSSVCKDQDLYMIPAGSAGDGFHLMDGGWKVTSDPQFADDPFVSWANTTLTAAGADIATGFFGNGFTYYGWAYVEALRIAAELDGGLTRTNFLLAQRAMSVKHPALLDGINFSANGAEDAYFVEGSQVSRYNAEAQAWEQTGQVLDIDEQTQNCVWDGAGC